MREHALQDFMHYNYVAMHGTIKTTPAAAAGLTDHQWTISEMLERIASYEKPQPKPPSIVELINRVPEN